MRLPIQGMHLFFLIYHTVGLFLPMQNPFHKIDLTDDVDKVAYFGAPVIDALITRHVGDRDKAFSSLEDVAHEM
jgi:hypothetical protein